MVTDKPPRRTKPRKEPVTIDATAAETEAVAEPVRSNDSDEVSGFNADPEPTDHTGLTEDKVVPEDAIPDTETVTSSEEAAPGETETAIHGEASTSTTAAHGEENRFGDSPTIAPTGRRGPSTSTLVASGVVGGIIALVLAGSMQYAGYLPGNGGATDAGAANEIAALRQEVEALRQDRGPDPDLQSRLQALETAAGQDTGDDTSERLAAFEQRLASVEQKLASATQELESVRAATETASSESTGRLDQLQQRLDALQARVDEPGPEQAAARAISAAALKTATDQGGSFQSQLEAFAAVAPDDPAVERLQPFAEQGVPTQAQLIDRFSQISADILEAVHQPDPEQGIASRLMSSALSVVKVRRTGDVEGDTPEAAVSRIEDALRSGNLGAAASAWETLPDEGKTISQDFKQALDARIAVDALIGDTVARAVSDTANQN